MKISKSHDLRWADAEKTQIDMKIENDALGVVPYTAHKDYDSYGLFKEALTGKYGEIKPFVLPVVPRDVAEAIKKFENEMKQKQRMEEASRVKTRAARAKTEKKKTTDGL